MNDLEDKIFDLLTQMYADFTTKFNNVTEDIKEVKEDIKTLKSDVAKINVKLDHDIDNKVNILLETRDESNKRLDNIEDMLQNISLKVEKQDVEIRVIKRAK